MGKTANYGLPKWEKSDFIKMDDFNAAFGKIDETLKANANADAVAAKAEAETVTAIAQTIAAARFAARSSAHTPAPVYRAKITRTASNAASTPRCWCCSARTADRKRRSYAA